MNPRHPVYVVSKGRHADNLRLTLRHFDAMGVPYRVVVEEQERAAYAEKVDPNRLLVLDTKYRDRYDALCHRESTQTKGSGPARNFAWEHSLAEGHERHWVVDDNIGGFYRLHQNSKNPVADGTIFRCMEDFAERYKNVAMAGPNYEAFTPRKVPKRPVTLNTRIYSCILILNRIPFRWRGLYNEDTILSLDALKAGWCTVLFNAFLQKKIRTMVMRGGNTDEVYKDGTLAKSRLLAKVHPDVARVQWRYSRWHHMVDYRPFAMNKLVPDPRAAPPADPEYGMRMFHLGRVVEGPTRALALRQVAAAGGGA